MALQLKQSLSLSQQLIMTPQLQQAIKLLQLSRLELLETISQELETNPLLDEQPGDEGYDENDPDKEIKEDLPQPAAEVKLEDDPGSRNQDLDWESYLSEYNTGWADTPHEDRDLPVFENINASKTNLHSHLMWQLNLSDLSESHQEIGVQIIGNIDDDGYLKASIEELSQLTGYPDDEILKT